MPRLVIPAAMEQRARQALALLRDGLDWWLGELHGMVPGFVRSLLGGRAPPLFLALQDEALRVQEGSGQVLGTLPLDGTGPLPEGLAERAAEAGAIVLILPESCVLQRTIELPLSAERELDAAMSFEIDRQTPFGPGQAYCRYRVLARDLGRKSLRVELAAAPRAVVDPALDAARSYGLAAGAIWIAEDDLQPPLDLLPRRESFRGGLWGPEPWRPIAAASALLLVLGTGAIAWHRHGQALELTEEVARRRAIGHRAQALRDEIETAEAAAQFLPDKRRMPPSIEIVDTLSRVLPDDSWVFGLDLSPREVRIEGFAGNVPALIERLQQIPIFEAPQLRAPVIRGPSNSRDRFDLALALKPRGEQ
jgi:general secretion pathway protein L